MTSREKTNNFHRQFIRKCGFKMSDPFFGKQGITIIPKHIVITLLNSKLTTKWSDLKPSTYLTIYCIIIENNFDNFAPINFLGFVWDV